MKKTPLVSVVIAAKNEEKNIANCLESIKRQTYPKRKIELIVVDDGSSDKTAVFARRFTNLVFRQKKTKERGEARNFGLRRAKGEYLLYLDADMIISATVIEKMVEKFETSDVVGFYISEIILGGSFWNRARRLERSFYDETLVDCVRAVRKEIFEKVGGFDKTMAGPEDWDFDRRVRKEGRVVILGSYDFEEIHSGVGRFDYRGNLVKQINRLTWAPLVFHNETAIGPKRYFSKKSYYAKSYARYFSKWGKDDFEVRKQFSFWYRVFGIFLEKGKWKRMFRHPFLVVGIYFLRFLTGVTYLFSLFRLKLVNLKLE